MHTYIVTPDQKRAVIKAFYSAGYNIIPIAADTKKPRVTWADWQAKRIPVETFCGWTKDFGVRASNWAVLCGVKPYADTPGIIVIDADDADAVKWVEANCPATPLRQRTAGGGIHFIFRRGDQPVRNATKIGGMNLDLRADGGYILLPYSATTKGTYQPLAGDWTDPAKAVADCPVFDPAWLPIATADEPGNTTGDADHDELVAGEWLPPVAERKAAARRYLENCPGAQQGSGADKYAFRLACKLVEDFALPADEAGEVLHEWGLRDDQKDSSGLHYPWAWGEINHKIKDAIRQSDPADIGAAYRDELPDLESRLDGLFGERPTPVRETPAPVEDLPDLYVADDPPPQPKKAEKEDRRDFCDGNEILTWPDPKWLIKNVLVENAFGLIYGLPGCYKTFLALDMALSLAHGKPFLGTFPVDETPIAYITPEGTAGLKKRLRAWMDKHGVSTLRNTRFNRHAFRLNEPEEVEAVITKVVATETRPRVLIIDTLARNFGGGDENSTRDMNAFVNNVMEIASRLDLACIVVHHAGKDTSKGPRGSIALMGAVDLAIEMNKDDTGATVRCRKQKDAEEFRPFYVRVEPGGGSLTLKYEEGEIGNDKNKKDETVADLMPTLSLLGKDEAAALTVGQLEAKGLPESTARYHLSKIVGLGYGVRVASKPARYYLTMKGVAAVLNNSQGKA